MRKQLTDQGIRALKPAPAGKRELLYDTLQPRLAVMVTDKGSKSFVWYGRVPSTGKPSRRFIGPAGVMSLTAAREKAREWEQQISEGHDPAKIAAAERAAEAIRRANSFESVAEAYIGDHVQRLRQARTTENEIRKHLVSRWGTRPVTDISSHDVAALCDDFRSMGIVAHGQNLFAHGRRIFRWAIHRRVYGLERSPFEGLSPSILIGPKGTRDRTLTDAELAALWQASGDADYPYGQLVRLLLLTGSRKSEAAEAIWTEFDFVRALWTIPAARFKGKRDHVFPLSNDVVDLLRMLPRFSRGQFLFSTTAGHKPVNGLSKMKGRLDTSMERSMAPALLAPWVLHDLRRTVRSRLSELRVPPAIAELTIGHQLPGLLKVYDKWEAMDERRDALSVGPLGCVTL